MALSRRARIEDLRDHHGAAWVESLREMASRMSPEQRTRLSRLWSEQMFLLARGKPSPRLDPAFDEMEAFTDAEWCVALTLAVRRLMRRVLEET